MWVVIASVPDLFIVFTFKHFHLKMVIFTAIKIAVYSIDMLFHRNVNVLGSTLTFIKQ